MNFGMTLYQICWYFFLYSFGGWVLLLVFFALFLADLIVTVCIIWGFNKKLKKPDELREELRVVSDRLSESTGGTLS